MKVGFLILARGGSKGLPGKNTMDLLGKPLIAYSIEQALQSRYCESVVVSTDDVDIAEIAVQFGALVPFRRPAELASDTAKSADAILHAISFLEQQGQQMDLLVLLEPTSPLREVSDMDNAIEMLIDNRKAVSCVSVVRTESAHPSFLFSRNEAGVLSAYAPGGNVIRRQDLDSFYYPEGSFYVARVEDYKANGTFYTKNATIGYELPKWQSFEIDTLEDFRIVEAILQAKNQGKFKS